MEKFEGTIILAIIDKSGSMDSIKSDAIGGFNTFLEEQQNAPGECLISTVLFDTHYNLIEHGLPIKESKKLTNETYKPGGMTSLYDSIGRGISDVEKMEVKADRYLAVILTDGDENTSKEYTKSMINKLITEKRSENWEFIFLAANQDAMAEGQSLGMSASNSVTFVADGDGVNLAYQRMSKGSMKYRSMSSDVYMSAKADLMSDDDTK